MLSDHCSVCPVSLSVTLVYCGQMVRWIKTKLGTKVGLGPGHNLLDGDPTLPQRGTATQFLAHICCGQMVAGVKIPLGMEVGLDPGDFVLDGNLLPLSKKGAEPPPHFFCPCLLWLNGWMDQDGSWHGGGPQPRRLYVRWGPTHSPKRGGAPLPNFRPISIAVKRLDASRWHLVWKYTS